MGLSVSTNFLAEMIEHDAEGADWFRNQISVVNQLLGEAGLPQHIEPEQRGPARMRRHVSSFPYSFLHTLRRAFARVREGQELIPCAAGDDPARDPAIEDASTLFNAHVLVHSDCEGFYAPIDFAEVIFDNDERGLPGGMLGSSIRLMAELVEVASAIGVALDNRGVLSDAEAETLAAETEDATPYWRERIVWLTLYEAARCSIANRSLIVFH